MTPLFCRKKRYFSTTSMLRDRYFGFPPLHRNPIKCFKVACPCLLEDRSGFKIIPKLDMDLVFFDNAVIGYAKIYRALIKATSKKRK